MIAKWQDALDKALDEHRITPEFRAGPYYLISELEAALAETDGGEQQKVRNHVQAWANNCAVYEEQHRREANTHSAEYHRGAKEAYQRVVDEILTSPPVSPAHATQSNQEEKMKTLAKSLLFDVILVIVGALLMPTPPAQACYYYCALAYCGGTRYGEQGWYRGVTFYGDYDILLQTPYCTAAASVQRQLYLYCSEFPCSSPTSTGVLYHAEDDKVSVFTIRNKREEDDIIKSIEQDGLAKAEKHFHPRDIVPVEEFNQYHTRLLTKLRAQPLSGK